jgi:hypothetical protein
MDVNNNENTGIVLYANLLSDIKTRIRLAQVKATLSANAEMIKMYWDIGRMIHKRQQQEGWSAAIRMVCCNYSPSIQRLKKRTAGSEGVF